MKNIWFWSATLLVLGACNFKKIDTKPAPIRFDKVLNFGDSRAYFPKAVLPTADSGYVVAGFSELNNEKQAFLLRLNEQGDPVGAVQNFGGPNTQARALAATADGGFIACGYTLQQAPGTDGQIWVAKFDASGNATQRVYGQRNRGEEAFGIAPLAGGNFAIGFSTYLSGNFGIRLLIVNGANADSIQEIAVNTATPFAPAQMISDADGNMALTGVDYVASKTRLLQIDAGGHVLLPSPDCPVNLFGPAVAVLPDKSLAIGGYTNQNDPDFYLSAYTQSGALRWPVAPQFSVGSGDDELWSVCATRDSQLLVFGFSTSYSGNPELYWSKRRAADGNALWPDDWHYLPDQRLSVITGQAALCGDGGFILCATMENSPGTLLLLKTDAEGDYHKPI